MPLHEFCTQQIAAQLEHAYRHTSRAVSLNRAELRTHSIERAKPRMRTGSETLVWLRIKES